MSFQQLASDDRVTRNRDALSAEIDGEVVALDVAQGACYGLDPVASRIWAVMANPVTIDQLCATLMAEYEVDAETCDRDVRSLVAELLAEGLASIESAPPPPPGA